jgi:hypothetical protein
MIELLQDGMAPLGIITPIPWILILLSDIPGLAAGPKKFLKYLLGQVAARKEVRFLFASMLKTHLNKACSTPQILQIYLLG